MKVLCVDRGGFEQITNDKEYDVLSETLDSFQIIANDGVCRYYRKTCFLVSNVVSNVLKPVLPDDSKARKELPIATCFLDYFAGAVAEVAKFSKIMNEKHNPGEPAHHARGKSSDHRDTIGRHLIDAGTTYVEDIQGVPHEVRHSTALAWRAMANLQEELEKAGLAVRPRGAWEDK